MLVMAIQQVNARGRLSVRTVESWPVFQFSGCDKTLILSGGAAVGGRRRSPKRAKNESTGISRDCGRERIGGNFKLPEFGASLWRPNDGSGSSRLLLRPRKLRGETFGSGHFGEWITDQFGLPAYRYTCNQISDPKAIVPPIKSGAARPIRRIRSATTDYRRGIQFRLRAGAPGRRLAKVPERLFAGGVALRRRNWISYRRPAGGQHLSTMAKAKVSKEF